MDGDQIDETGIRGERIVGDHFVVLFNAHDDAVPFRLGTRKRYVRWTCVLDTAAVNEQQTFEHMDVFPLLARSVSVLCGQSTELPLRSASADHGLSQAG